MSVDDRVLEKLAKLMEMAERGTEHEAQVAAQRAAELMAKHQIAAADVPRQRDDKPTVETGRIDGDDYASRVEAWHKILGSVVADSLGGRMWMYGKGRYQRFMMIGPPDTVGAARYLYLSISRQVNRLARARARELGETQNAWRRAYCMGAVARIAERLKEGRRSAMSGATSTALVWVDRQKEAVDEAYADLGELRRPKLGRQQRPDAGSYGYEDADKVDVGGGDRDRLGQGRRELKS